MFLQYDDDDDVCHTPLKTEAFHYKPTTSQTQRAPTVKRSVVNSVAFNAFNLENMSNNPGGAGEDLKEHTHIHCSLQNYTLLGS